jgi:hypothetical protein
MLTFTITGPKAEAEKAATKLRTMLQFEGKIVALFPQGLAPDKIHPHVNVIIVVKPED